MEGPNLLEFGEHELDNLGSEEEVEGSLQEGPLPGVKFPKFLKNFHINMAQTVFIASFVFTYNHLITLEIYKKIVLLYNIHIITFKSIQLLKFIISI